MSSTQAQPHFKHFNKYDFVKSFTAPIKDPQIKEEKEREAVIIAEAFEQAELTSFENLATKHDLQVLKYQIIGSIAAMIVILPPLTEFIKKLFLS